MTYNLAERVDRLVHMTDLEWGMYAFSRDPVKGKISETEKIEFIKAANACGIKQARRLQEKYGRLAVSEYARMLGLQIHDEDSEGSDNYIVFAKYNYPKSITIYMKNVAAMNQLIAAEGLEEALGKADIKSILIAHEMYHYCEENWEDVYSKETKIVLWKIAGFKYKTNILALGEIAAMAFARELLGLSYNPYVFDSLMLYPHNQEKAVKLMDEIFLFRQVEDKYKDE